jgi:hypothetical protein
MDLGKAGYSELSTIAFAMSPEPVSRNDLKEALDWLIKAGMVEGKKHFTLTATGKEIFTAATRETSLMPEVWAYLEKYISDRLNSFWSPPQN